MGRDDTDDLDAIRGASPRDQEERRGSPWEAVECRYLSDGAIGVGEDAPEVECLALSKSLVLSPRQRDLVCLLPIHETCPRFLRANVVRYGTLHAPRRGRILGRVRLPIAAVLVGFVAVAAVLATGFRVPSIAANPPTANVLGATATAEGSDPGATAALPTAADSASPDSSPSPPLRSPAPSWTAPASPSWPPGATASRMQLLTPCPGASGCYLYRVRPNDNFVSIASFFGVSRQAILALNPAIKDPDQVRDGQTIRIPPPTR